MISSAYFSRFFFCANVILGFAAPAAPAAAPAAPLAPAPPPAPAAVLLVVLAPAVPFFIALFSTGVEFFFGVVVRGRPGGAVAASKLISSCVTYVWSAALLYPEPEPEPRAALCAGL